MAEYTIPKPYRDFYVTNPAVETLEMVRTIEEVALPKPDLMSGSTISGINTLEGANLDISVKNENIIGYPYQNNSYTSGDASFTAQTDGGIILSGTPTAPIAMNLVTQLPLNPNSCYLVGLTGEYENVVISYNLLDSSGMSGVSDQTNPARGNVATLDLSKFPTVSVISLNIRRCYNNVAMSGTAYPFLKLVDDTKTTVYATGKNLLKPCISGLSGETQYRLENDVFTVLNNGVEEWSFIEVPLNGLESNTVYTLSYRAVSNYMTDLNVLIRVGRVSEADTFTNLVYAALDESLNKYVATFTTPQYTGNLSLILYGSKGTYYEGAETTYSMIQVEKGSSVTDYEPYHGQEISCQVGDTINVQQYDRHTCITADNIHVTLSGEFIEKVEYLLNERPVILVGLFDSRPTDTADYPRIYVATDKTDTDRTTLLQANQSGATASNWIYI